MYKHSILWRSEARAILGANSKVKHLMWPGTSLRGCEVSFSVNQSSVHFHKHSPVCGGAELRMDRFVQTRRAQFDAQHIALARACAVVLFCLLSGTSPLTATRRRDASQARGRLNNDVSFLSSTSHCHPLMHPRRQRHLFYMSLGKWRWCFYVHVQFVLGIVLLRCVVLIAYTVFSIG